MLISLLVKIYGIRERTRIATLRILGVDKSCTSHPDDF